MTRNHISLIESLFFCCNYFEKAHVPLLTLSRIFVLLKCHEDIELNPGPKKFKKNSLSISHQNLNSLTTQDFPKLRLLKVYNSTDCLSETCLDYRTLDSLLKIEGFNLVQ